MATTDKPRRGRDEGDGPTEAEALALAAEPTATEPEPEPTVIAAEPEASEQVLDLDAFVQVRDLVPFWRGYLKDKHGTYARPVSQWMAAMAAAGS